MTGTITLVATPIGNLGDVSDNCRAALEGADVIACEDTRRAKRLLAALGIEGRRMVVVNEHTESDAASRLVAEAQGGAQIALVTDAGMPAISDPGERVVAEAIRAGVSVTAVPGPSAALTALSLSGLPTGRFAFEGFLPRKGSARSARLAAVAADDRTTILYEAPHRVARTVGDLRDAAGGERQVVLARELTKRFEELWRGTLAEAVDHLAETEPRGEFVVVLDGAPPREAADDAAIVEALRLAVEAGSSTRDAVTEVATELGEPRRRVYQLAIELDQPDD